MADLCVLTNYHSSLPLAIAIWWPSLEDWRPVQMSSLEEPPPPNRVDIWWLYKHVFLLVLKVVLIHFTVTYRIITAKISSKFLLVWVTSAFFVKSLMDYPLLASLLIYTRSTDTYLFFKCCTLPRHLKLPFFTNLHAIH